MPSIGDTLFNFAEWLRTTQLVEFSLWLSETRLSLFLQENFWLIPGFQTLHILALGALFGSAVMLNLRVLGKVGMSRTIAQTANRYVPWIRWGLIVLLISGCMLIVGEPVRELINPIFWLKMLMIVITVIVSMRYHNSVLRKAAILDTDASGSASIRRNAVLLLILWCVVMAGGRWIAYAPV